MATKNVSFYGASQPLLGGKIQREYAPARNMAQSLMQAGGSMAPVQSWQEGMARALQGGIGGYLNYATMKAQGDREAAQSQGITKALKAANQMIPGMPGVPVGGYTGTVEGEMGTPDIPAQRGGWQAFSDALPEGRDFNDARMRAAMGLMGQQEAEAAEAKARETFLFEQGNTYRAPVKGTTDQENFAQYKNETLAAGKIPMSFQDYQHSDALASQGILYNPQPSAQPSAQQAVSPIVDRVEESPEFMVQPNLLGSGATNQAIQPPDVNIQPSRPQPVNRPIPQQQSNIIPGSRADLAARQLTATNRRVALAEEKSTPKYIEEQEELKNQAKFNLENKKLKPTRRNAILAQIDKIPVMQKQFKEILDLSKRNTTSGTTGQILGMRTGSDQWLLNQKMKSVESLVGLGELIEAKRKGATFGALQKSEMDLLIASVGALNAYLPHEELEKTLKTIDDLAAKALGRQKFDYNELYGESYNNNQNLVSKYGLVQ